MRLCCVFRWHYDASLILNVQYPLHILKWNSMCMWVMQRILLRSVGILISLIDTNILPGHFLCGWVINGVWDVAPANFFARLVVVWLGVWNSGHFFG
jgi:hypothetical protein